jgi:hypothetical protein
MLFTVPTLILLFAISTVALLAARKKFFPEIAICNKRKARSNLKPSLNLHIPSYNVMIWNQIWGLGLSVGLKYVYKSPDLCEDRKHGHRGSEVIIPQRRHYGL